MEEKSSIKKRKETLWSKLRCFSHFSTFCVFSCALYSLCQTKYVQIDLIFLRFYRNIWWSFWWLGNKVYLFDKKTKLLTKFSLFLLLIFSCNISNQYDVSAVPVHWIDFRKKTAINMEKCCITVIRTYHGRDFCFFKLYTQIHDTVT